MDFRLHGDSKLRLERCRDGSTQLSSQATGASCHVAAIGSPLDGSLLEWTVTVRTIDRSCGAMFIGVAANDSIPENGGIARSGTAHGWAGAHGTYIAGLEHAARGGGVADTDGGH